MTSLRKIKIVAFRRSCSIVTIIKDTLKIVWFFIICFIPLADSRICRVQCSGPALVQLDKVAPVFARPTMSSLVKGFVCYLLTLLGLSILFDFELLCIWFVPSHSLEDSDSTWLQIRKRVRYDYGKNANLLDTHTGHLGVEYVLLFWHVKVYLALLISDENLLWPPASHVKFTCSPHPLGLLAS